jgi:hypothetical protein
MGEHVNETVREGDIEYVLEGLGKTAFYYSYLLVLE